MTESELQRLIMVAVSKAGHRVFRNNVAEGWIGVSTGPLRTDMGLRVRAGSVIITNARRLHAGLCVGSHDLIGYSSAGKFLSIECKSRSGKLTDEQRNFMEQIRIAGGIAIEGRSVEQVLEELNDVKS